MEEDRSQNTLQIRKNYRDALAFVDNFSEQLRMAGQVQRDFLPKQLPNSQQLKWAAIFEPVEWVSGDIYDIVRLDENHIGFYLADVVGHGMPAALLTMFLKQALVMRQTSDDSYHIFSPAEAMANLNSRLTSQELSSQQFVTCCYCLLNTKTLQLTYCRAGHPYPVLMRQGENVRQLEGTGSLLGIFEGLEYKQQSVQLQQGDKLMLYSDGIEPYIGDFNEMNGFYFKQEFCRIKDMPLTEMVAEIKAIIESQRVKPAEADDITVVGLEIL